MMKVKKIFSVIFIFLFFSYLFAGNSFANAPTNLYVGYPNTQSNLTNPVNFTYATPFFSVTNIQGIDINVVQIQLAASNDVDYLVPIWNSGDINISSLGNGSISAIVNGSRIPDVFYGMGNPPTEILQAGRNYIWRIRTGINGNYSEWSLSASINMTIDTNLTARFYENKDTFYGTFYATEGWPDYQQTTIGGWSDFYYGYFEWDLSLSPDANKTVSSTLHFYCVSEQSNNPEAWVRMVTSPWTETSVTKANHPTATTDGQILLNKPKINTWSVINILNFYTNWKDGIYPNYGIMFNPTRNNATLHAVANSDYPGINLDPYMEVIYTPTVQNKPPVANAGADQSIIHNGLITLDGSNSYDPDKNYPLSFKWTLVSKPENSLAVLSDSISANPTFLVDELGDYILDLVVTDSLGLSSVADRILVSTLNTPPVSNAGLDQLAIVIGSVIQLDGTQSYDEEGNEINYFWTITEKPAGSTAVLFNANSATPTIALDVNGVYKFELVVSDSWNSSSSDSVVVTFSNVAPIANAGLGQSVLKGQTVYLNGGGSSDANQNILTYSWSMVSKPEGSLVEIINANSAQPNFVTDLAGEYIVSLVVNDGFVDSEPSNVVIMAITYQDATTNVLQSAQDEINLAIPTEFKNSNQQNALTNKINSVLEKIDQGLYQEALDKLRDDIIKKTDGCPLTGQPDNNDWIKDCETQIEVYNFVLNAINLLEQLI